MDQNSFVDWPNRWDHIHPIISRSGPLAPSEFEPDPALLNTIQNSVRLLVVGAGGLGCELLKNLCLSGFRNIDVIDMDIIDTSNLNRQFLFRTKDVGKPKAVVAAEFINSRIPGANIIPHFCKIQDKDETFYRSFNVVVCGLDSVPARRWINAMLISLLKYHDDGTINPASILPLIDGGTEGFKGQTRVILPGISSCFECSLSTYPPQVTYPLCTIATTPRLPEHCIEYAKIVLWPKIHPEEDMDTDNPEHLQWLYHESLQRAQSFGIHGVTYRLTQGVVKNIVPAIASTNAIIAASCALEVFKIATSCHSYLNNYAMYNGQEGVYTYTFEYEKVPDCLVCSVKQHILDLKTLLPNVFGVDILFRQVLNLLTSNEHFQMQSPGVRFQEKTIYMPRPPSLESKTKMNLDKTLVELGIESGSVLIVTDSVIPHAVEFVIKY